MYSIVCVVFCILARFECGQSVDNDEMVNGFPGQMEAATFKQYSGFLDISPTRHIHYVFFESQLNPSTDPVVFWTNGGVTSSPNFLILFSVYFVVAGPGCSGLLGLFAELGPWRPKKLSNSTLKLKANPFSWNRIANLVFIEQPVGVGFSYSDIPLKDIRFSDAMASSDNLKVVKKFFEKYPSIALNDFYLAGESYGGHYIPQWALRILSDDDLVKTFKGMLIGNPYVRIGSLLAGSMNVQWGLQMLPKPLWDDAVHHSCHDMAIEFGDYPVICAQMWMHFKNMLSHINPCKI
jgi:cathepsin A (carboxypeptidase C)